MKTRRGARSCLAIIALAVGLFACPDDDDGSGPGSGPGEPPPGVKFVNVVNKTNYQIAVYRRTPFQNDWSAHGFTGVGGTVLVQLKSGANEVVALIEDNCDAGDPRPKADDCERRSAPYTGGPAGQTTFNVTYP
jgi:hypothetical protein